MVDSRRAQVETAEDRLVVLEEEHKSQQKVNVDVVIASSDSALVISKFIKDLRQKIEVGFLSLALSMAHIVICSHLWNFTQLCTSRKLQILNNR
jgi:zona occludens toxin (predicted ATPase)